METLTALPAVNICSPYLCMQRRPVSQDFHISLKLSRVSRQIGGSSDRLNLQPVNVGIGIDQCLQLADGLLTPLGQCDGVKVKRLFKLRTDPLPQTGYHPCTK